MSYQKGIVATLPELQDFYKGQEAGAIIELMNQTNDILTDIPWMESNQSDGHLTRIRTGLPTVYWRRLYQGIPPSKGEYSQVKEVCGMLEARMELDKREIELYADRAAAWRLSESKAFTESMRQTVAETLFYGDNSKNSDEFNGLCMRYSTISKDKHCIDAGGTTVGKLTSMWLICWGAETTHGLYPKGSSGGLTHEDLGEGDARDDNGNYFRAVRDLYGWKCGLTVRDWRSCVRIANIDTAMLTKKQGQNGFVDLQRLTIEAKNKLPANMRQKAIWYCNQEVLTALELQSIDHNSIHLMYGEYFDSKAVPMLHGRPIRQCDVIKTNEDKVN